MLEKQRINIRQKKGCDVAFASAKTHLPCDVSSFVPTVSTKPDRESLGLNLDQKINIYNNDDDINDDDNNNK